MPLMGEKKAISAEQLAELVKMLEQDVMSQTWGSSPIWDDLIKMDPAPIDYSKEYEKLKDLPVVRPTTTGPTLIELTERNKVLTRQLETATRELALAVEARDKLYKCWLDDQQKIKQLQKQLEEAKQGKRFKSVMR